MKLNLDCMRDILLALEEKDIFEVTDSFELQEELTNHTNHDILYACAKLLEANFIAGEVVLDHDEYSIQGITSITYAGHQFLAEISSNKIWNKTKKILNELEIKSISGISSVAANVVQELIRANLNI